VYARRIEKKGETKTLTFAVSGMLWNRSLVMIDSETNSLWSHLLGRSMAGPSMDTQLKVLPGLMTDWKTWRQRHPDTTVLKLSRTSQGYLKEFYAEPARFVIGMSEGDKARSWSFDVLLQNPFVNDHFADRPILVTFDDQSSTAFVYNRRLAGDTLEFELKDGQLTDRQSGSQWNPATGQCENGPQAGQVLELIPAIVSYRHTWETFYPDSPD